MTASAESQALTDAEHAALKLTGELWDLLCKQVVGDGAAGDQDRQEIAWHLHAVQRAILAQAAGRAYPDLYRLLGGGPPGASQDQRGIIPG